MTAPRSHQRDRFTIAIVSGLWRGADVVVEPPTASRCMRHFATHAQAVAYAQDLARVEGWTIVDRTGGPSCN